MQRFKVLRGMAAVILALMIGVMGTALAQDDTETDDFGDLTFEVTGEVTFTEDGDIMIGDLVLAPNSAFIPATLEEGDTITVIGILLNDDTLQVMEFTNDTEEEGVNNENEEADDVVDDTDEVDDTNDGVDDTEQAVSVSPIAALLADEFGLEYETVVEWHNSGMGYGQITQTLLLAEELDTDVETLIEQLAEGGQSPAQLARAAGISPSQLAPGRVIAGKVSAYANANTIANLRSGPGTDNEVVGTVQPGDTFVVIEEGENWLLVELEDGTQAYIYSDLVAQDNRPGRPDHAGRPDNAGPPDHAGRPDNAGPPDHAGRPDNAGPPDHAGGPGRGNGNGNGNRNGN